MQQPPIMLYTLIELKYLDHNLQTILELVKQFERN